MVNILYIHSNGNPHRDSRFIEELQKHSDVRVTVCDAETMLWSLQSRDRKINTDCVINMHRNKQIADILKNKNIPCYNDIDGQFLANDKWECYLALNKINIPQPNTSRTYIDGSTNVYKDRYGSYGRNIYLVENDIGSNEDYIYQTYIKESAGKSIRVVMVNKKPIAAVLKVNTKTFKSHYAYGGYNVRYKVTPELQEMCIKVAEHLKLNYCALDILESNQGYLLLEVNSCAGLQNIESFTGVNIAKHVVDDIVNKYKKPL